jgi:homoserine kinase
MREALPKRISVRVPATSANLGCLFDCAALALALYLDIHITLRDDGEITIRYCGLNPERISLGPDNLVARTINETLHNWGKHRGFDLEIDNQIPVGVGLGSSAAAIVGALAACHWLANRALFDEELLSLANQREGHPDNVSAAWLGGFTVSIQEGKRVLAFTCPVPDTLDLVLVVPDYALPTEKAREVLPTQYSRADAIHNMQRAAVLASQLFSGKAEFHRAFFDDRWHQPYRAPLVPGLSEVLQLEHPDLLGVCLSGAGPAILAFTRGSSEAIGGLIQQTLAAKQVNAKVCLLAADNRGAKGWSIPA